MVTYSPVSRAIEQASLMPLVMPQIDLHSSVDKSASTQKLGTITVYDVKVQLSGGDFRHSALSAPPLAPLPLAPPPFCVPPVTDIPAVPAPPVDDVDPAAGVVAPPLPDSGS
jgi:hypothetical protein